MASATCVICDDVRDSRPRHARGARVAWYVECELTPNDRDGGSIGVFGAAAERLSRLNLCLDLSELHGSERDGTTTVSFDHVNLP